jgi:hypothetical protein
MAARRKREDEWDRQRRLEKEHRRRVIAAMVATPAFLRIEARKDKALRAWTVAESMALTTKRQSDIDAMHRAERNAKRAMRAVQRYEDAYMRKHGVSW